MAKLSTIDKVGFLKVLDPLFDQKFKGEHIKKENDRIKWNKDDLNAVK